MSDFDGGASNAPAESVPAPAPAPAPELSLPKPVSASEPIAPEPKEEKPVSTREALQKAQEKVNQGAKEAKPEPKEPPKAEAKPSPAKEGPSRAEDGKFAPKDGTQPKPAETAQDGQKTAAAASDAPKPETGDDEPPARFKDTAKAKWAAADPEVRAEVRRMEKELTGGLEKYKASHERYESDFKEYDELAKAQGANPKEVIGRYVSMERLLSRDPIAGYEAIAANMGHTFRQVAEAYLGRTPDQASAANDAAIREARGQAQAASQAAQQLQQANAQLQETVNSLLQEQVTSFQKTFPRFDELRATAGGLIQAGLASNMTEAFEMAGNLRPAAQAPAPTPAPSPAPASIDLEAQTLKGSKSISGAPSAGSNPVSAKQPSRSSREAVERAMAQAGAR